MGNAVEDYGSELIPSATAPAPTPGKVYTLTAAPAGDPTPPPPPTPAPPAESVLVDRRAEPTAPRKIVMNAGEVMPPHELHAAVRMVNDAEHMTFDEAKAEIDDLIRAIEESAPPISQEEFVAAIKTVEADGNHFLRGADDGSGTIITRTSMDGDGNIIREVVPPEEFYKTEHDANWEDALRLPEPPEDAPLMFPHHSDDNVVPLRKMWDTTAPLSDHEIAKLSGETYKTILQRQRPLAPDDLIKTWDMAAEIEELKDQLEQKDRLIRRWQQQQTLDRSILNEQVKFRRECEAWAAQLENHLKDAVEQIEMQEMLLKLSDPDRPTHDELQLENERLKKEAAQSQVNWTQTREYVARLEQENEHLEEQIKTQAAMIESFREKPATDNESIAQLEQSRNSWIERNQQMERERDELQVRVNEKEHLIVELAQQRNDMAVARDAWREQYETLRDDPKVPPVFQERIDELRSKIEMYEDAVTKLNTRIDELCRINETQAAALGVNESVRQGLAGDNEQLRERIDELRLIVNQCVSYDYAEQLERQIETLKARIGNAPNDPEVFDRIRELEALVSALQEKEPEWARRVEVRDDHIRELEAKLTELESQSMVKQILQLQEQLHHTIKDARDSASFFGSRIENLEAALADERKFSAEKKEQIVQLEKKAERARRVFQLIYDSIKREGD